MQEPKGPCSPSHCPMWNPPLCFSFPPLHAQQSLFLTSYLCIHLGKNFLDFIPKLRPCHSQTWCCVRMIRQFPIYLSCQTDRARDLEFFCCPVSHLTQCPKNLLWEFLHLPALESWIRAIFHSAQLQFLQGSLFEFIRPLHSSPWQPPQCYQQSIRLLATRKPKL